MKKGHYGHNTGNARHSRKEEIIHQREIIYDAKTQIHNEDEKYKHTGKSGYKQDMIHERELIHDTKTQIHHADQDYKHDGPKMYGGRMGHSGAGAYASGLDLSVDHEVRMRQAKQKTIEDITKGVSNIVSSIEDGKDNNESSSETKKDKIATNFAANQLEAERPKNSFDPSTYAPQVLSLIHI